MHVMDVCMYGMYVCILYDFCCLCVYIVFVRDVCMRVTQVCTLCMYGMYAGYACMYVMCVRYVCIFCAYVTCVWMLRMIVFV